MKWEEPQPASLPAKKRKIAVGGVVLSKLGQGDRWGVHCKPCAFLRKNRNRVRSLDREEH